MYILYVHKQTNNFKNRQQYVNDVYVKSIVYVVVLWVSCDKWTAIQKNVFILEACLEYPLNKERTDSSVPVPHFSYK